MADLPAIDFNLITTDDAMRQATDRFADAAQLFVDTEFMRERTYHPELALVQVCARGHTVIIDPLAFDAAEALGALLGRADQVKVFHAAGQDLEVLHHATGVVPAPLFDTQLAASLLGYGDQIGYGALISRTLGVDLPKGYARMDWKARPIDPDALAYAAADVHYLEAAYARLIDELTRLGRADWLDEDFAAMVEPSRWQVAPASAWRKLKGLRKLRAGQRQIAARLAAWREHEALRRNRPRRWVLKDDPLLDIARRKPSSPAALSKIRGIEPKTVDRDGDAILAALGDDAHWPELETLDAAPLAARSEPVVDAAMAVLRERAEAAQMTASAIANRSDLTALVAGERDLDLLAGWRRRVAGAALLDLVEGRSALRVTPGDVPALRVD